MANVFTVSFLSARTVSTTAGVLYTSYAFECERRVQAKDAEAFAAEAADDSDAAVARLKEAVTIEDSIDDLPQPPYPAIPANELCGNLLLELHRPTEASTYFEKALKRTPNRPKVIFGLARAAQDLGDEVSSRPPLLAMRCSSKLVEQLNCPASDRELIYHRNAERLPSLKPSLHHGLTPGEGNLKTP